MKPLPCPLVDKMASVLIRVPIFHRCGFPNAKHFEACLSCAVDAVLQEWNAMASPDYPSTPERPIPESGMREALKVVHAFHLTYEKEQNPEGFKEMQRIVFEALSASALGRDKKEME